MLLKPSYYLTGSLINELIYIFDVYSFYIHKSSIF
jgi:hypothetical protein